MESGFIAVHLPLRGGNVVNSSSLAGEMKEELLRQLHLGLARVNPIRARRVGVCYGRLS